MRFFTCVAFCVVLAALTWVVINQQRMSRDLRILVNENRRLMEMVNGQPAMPSTTPDKLQPLPGNRNNLIPGQPATLNPGEVPVNRSYRPIGVTPPPRIDLLTNGEAGLLTSHAADGKLLTRPWGPEQVVGPPNTMQAGDQSTAWAQYTSSGGEGEWLHVTFKRVVEIAEVIVRETYNPGAISKVTALLPNGQETTIWEGTEPSVQAPVDMSFPATQKLEANAVKIYLDRRRASGWNEIDAVELVGRDGSRQWASSATVSSAYSISPGATAGVPPGARVEEGTLQNIIIQNGDVIRK